MKSIKKQKDGLDCSACCPNNKNNCACSNGVYGLGFLGAIFYFFQNATTFSDYLWGIGKAIIWPALLIYQLLAKFS